MIFHVFSDGSVDTKTKMGFGAFLIVPTLSLPRLEMAEQVQTVCFNGVGSTDLELKVLLSALSQLTSRQLGEPSKVSPADVTVHCYTDSQNIIRLPERREALEARDFYPRNPGPTRQRLQHYELYQQFYRVLDILDCQFVKVKGHQPSADKTHIERIFGLVDKASRRALRSARH